MMKRLLVHTGLGTSSQVRGALLPGGTQKVVPGGGGCLLVGDAACLCDRVSGEGISHAIESGFAAADAVTAGRETWHENAGCVHLVEQSMRYRKLLYGKHFSRLAAGALKRSDRWFRKYWDIVCGDADYSRLLKP
jgi:flavin-dependent dehydrogenase